MAANVTLKVAGLEKLERNIKALNEAARTKAVTRGAAAGARELRKAAKERAPQGETGRLKANIYIFKVRELSTKNSAYYAVRVRRQGKAGDAKNAYYWYFVEFGTSKQPAQAFMRRAFAEASGIAEAKMKERIVREVLDALKET